MNAQRTSTWSDVYCNTTHYGPWSTISKWSTVQLWGDFTQLTCWIGANLSSPQFTFYGDGHESAARMAGEAWYARGIHPETNENVIQSR